MHHAGSVLFQGQTLQDQVVTRGLLDVDQTVLVVVGFEHVGVRRLANLTLELLEVVRTQRCLLLATTLRLQPFLQTFVMYILDTSPALA